MGDVECQLVINASVLRPNLDGAVNIDHQIAAPCIVFTRDRVIAEADHIRRTVFAEVFQIGASDALIIHENNGDFAPAIRRSGGIQFTSKPISQPL